jgi:hypothetical protein
VSIDERHRIALHEAARQTWGPEIAGTLMEMLPPGGWAEVATKTDVVAVKSDLSVLGKELRAEMSELRSELHTGIAGVRVEMAGLGTTLERSLRTHLMWMITTMVAGFGAVAAVTGLAR